MGFGFGIKRSALDKLFSDYIRTRDNWTCQYCLGDYSNMRHILDCSHFVTRGNKSTRWDEDNAVALCRGHHDFMGKNPHIHSEFFKKRLGPRHYDALILRSHLTAKQLRVDEKLLKIFYKLALKEMNNRILGHRE